eukprot:TRINITY_DN671_c0_g1_i4.p1 TRINITY_DN671_c0_g1~~TRINITY_DN671_c0_g1_i4.p1  ORF type:complete len:1033 (+),score=295.74 TRINITY_DN671_c0_g1_i4:390-3101(+)
MNEDDYSPSSTDCLDCPHEIERSGWGFVSKRPSEKKKIRSRTHSLSSLEDKGIPLSRQHVVKEIVVSKGSQRTVKMHPAKSSKELGKKTKKNVPKPDPRPWRANMAPIPPRKPSEQTKLVIKPKQIPPEIGIPKHGEHSLPIILPAGKSFMDEHCGLEGTTSDLESDLIIRECNGGDGGDMIVQRKEEGLDDERVINRHHEEETCVTKSFVHDPSCLDDHATISVDCIPHDVIEEDAFASKKIAVADDVSENDVKVTKEDCSSVSDPVEESCHVGNTVLESGGDEDARSAVESDQTYRDEPCETGEEKKINAGLSISEPCVVEIPSPESEDGLCTETSSSIPEVMQAADVNDGDVVDDDDATCDDDDATCDDDDDDDDATCDELEDGLSMEQKNIDDDSVGHLGEVICHRTKYSHKFRCFSDILSGMALQNVNLKGKGKEKGKESGSIYCGSGAVEDWMTVAQRVLALAKDHNEKAQRSVRDEGHSRAILSYKVVKNRPDIEHALLTSTRDMRDVVWLENSVSGSMWNVWWTWKRPSKPRFEDMIIFQRLNHFPQAFEMTRKDNLKRNIQRYSRLPGSTGSYFSIIPPTYTLPREYTQFVEHFSSCDDEPNMWIMKPVGKSRGRGISIVADILDVAYGEGVVMQQYIHNPLLIDGFKFDLRLYVLVLSFQPVLHAFLYSDGFARLATTPYDPSPKNRGDLFMHLTNTSIQKEVAGGKDGESLGTKLRLEEMYHRLDFDLDAQNTLWTSISELIIKTLACVEDRIEPCLNAFELYGFDVLIDQTMRPWLIEVNASPSLEMEFAVDYEVKVPLLQDILRLVNPCPFDRTALQECIERRLGEARSAHPSRWMAIDSESKSLDEDMKRILCNIDPDKIDEIGPMGDFVRIAPSPMYSKICKVRRMTR